MRPRPRRAVAWEPGHGSGRLDAPTQSAVGVSAISVFLGAATTISQPFFITCVTRANRRGRSGCREGLPTAAGQIRHCVPDDRAACEANTIRIARRHLKSYSGKSRWHEKAALSLVGTMTPAGRKEIGLLSSAFRQFEFWRSGIVSDFELRASGFPRRGLFGERGDGEGYGEFSDVDFELAGLYDGLVVGTDEFQVVPGQLEADGLGLAGLDLHLLEALE